MQVHALVVDDSGIMRKMVMRSLMEAKLCNTILFTEAKDGAEGLALFNPETMHVVFADWNMPNMNGLEMVKEIRARHPKHVPVVMITTEGTMQRIDEALNQAGVDSYIIKPFTPDVIRQKLQPLFDKIVQQEQKPEGFFTKLAAKMA